MQTTAGSRFLSVSSGATIRTAAPVAGNSTKPATDSHRSRTVAAAAPWTGPDGRPRPPAPDEDPVGIGQRVECAGGFAVNHVDRGAVRVRVRLDAADVVGASLDRDDVQAGSECGDLDRDTAAAGSHVPHDAGAGQPELAERDRAHF